MTRLLLKETSPDGKTKYALMMLSVFGDLCARRNPDTVDAEAEDVTNRVDRLAKRRR